MRVAGVSREWGVSTRRSGDGDFGREAAPFIPYAANLINCHAGGGEGIKGEGGGEKAGDVTGAVTDNP